ncbi:MAG: hypothetical protein QOF57_1580 [Frankiaceae bacterium]|jgi:hypothetical protein|nr:hypothetical protein [Frankiaceae bacterium]
MATLVDRVASLHRRVSYAPDEEALQVEAAVLNAAVTASRRRPSVLADVVRTHSPNRVAAARAATLEDFLAIRREAVGESLSTVDVARRLGISAAAVTKRRAAGRLVAFRHKGDWRYPSWQFAGSSLLPGAVETWTAMPALHDDLARVRWFGLPSAALGGRSPLHALQDGDIEAVVDAATYVGSR